MKILCDKKVASFLVDMTVIFVYMTRRARL